MHAYSGLKQAEKSGTKTQAQPEATKECDNEVNVKKPDTTQQHADIFAQRRVIVDMLDFFN